MCDKTCVNIYDVVDSFTTRYLKQYFEIKTKLSKGIELTPNEIEIQASFIALIIRLNAIRGYKATQLRLLLARDGLLRIKQYAQKFSTIPDTTSSERKSCRINLECYLLDEMNFSSRVYKIILTLLSNCIHKHCLNSFYFWIERCMIEWINV